MAVYRLGERVPTIHPTAWVAPSADLIGLVELAENSSVWFNAALRGEPIVLGANSNIQEGSVLHTDPGSPLIIGQWVTVGHQAMLHGCTIGDGSLIGMQAIVLNGARIGRECLIGAGALIGEGKEIPDRSVVLGSPGRVVRQLTDEQVAQIRAGVATYVERARYYREQLKPL
ncbi:MAG TPA: gamma carbonic anhydrase family protein [Burkholderiaceae bacterium]|nr:gamma carbonic anhydrase family protein [Burkholderiaceae bacterium]